MLHEPQKQESPYTSRRSLLGAKGGFLDLSPSPEAASYPFKRKDVGIKRNPWREEKAQRKGAKEIHKNLMAKKSFNEKNKMKNGLDAMLNKLQNSEKEVVALKAEKQKFQHELKNTTNTSIASCRH
ncbi:hypothetical protein Taro_024578 [Colocasia esculenta]|uniref:Uncharacterized protein n=1 Tax=Colocasia esculenta TaxID=4460 RepID=A0A843V7U9_COLES|nr:hypothetical protein [Colocasia esculenta]